MTIQELIDKLQKVENKNLEVKFTSIYSGEDEDVDLVGDFVDYILLCTNDMCDEDVDFI